MKEKFYYPETIHDETSIILMPNRLGGAHTDDLGVRAQLVADATLQTVLAYERPSTATTEPAGVYSAESLLLMAQERAQQLAELTSEYEVVHAIGHSAAASEAILIASGGLLPFGKVVALDPVMMEVKKAPEGVKSWLKEQIFRQYEPIPYFEGVAIGAAIPNTSPIVSLKRAKKELTAYKNCFWTDVVRSALYKIEANGLAEVYVYMAGESGMSNAEKVSVEFSDAKHVQSVTIPDGNHSFAEPYGNFEYFARQHFSPECA